MTFLHPAIFAAAAACVAVPILIHLLSRRRRRPVLWGAMRFLLEAYRKQRRRLQIEQLLLLATRCLIVLLAGAAIARPLLEAAGALGGGASRTLYLVIDTSLASSAKAEAGGATSLDRLKAQAVALLAALGPSDRAALITVGAPAEAAVLPPSPDIAAVRGLVERLAPTDAPADWAGAAQRIAADLSGARDGAADVTVAALSDFLLGSLDPAQPSPKAFAALPEGVRVRVLASNPADPAAAPGNTQVIAVEPLRPVVLTGADSPQPVSAGGQEQVRVLLRRAGPSVREAATSSVRLTLAGPSGPTAASKQARGTVRWTPGQVEASATLTLDASDLTAGDLSAAALIAEIDQDAVPGDNAFRRPVAVRDALRVGIVDQRRFGSARLDRLGAGEWLRLALRPGGGAAIETTDIPPAALDAAAIAGLDALFLPRPDLIEADAWSRLRRFVDGGGLIVVSPPAETNVHAWSDALGKAMGLGWRVARESRAYDAPISFAPEQPTSAVLALLRAELPELLKPVTISRTLPIEQPAPGARTLLALADGTPWLIAMNPGAADAAQAGEGPAQADALSSAGSGLVVYLASAPTLEWTDAPAKPLMVPLAQELARQGVGESLAAWEQTAGALLRAPRRSAELVEAREGSDRLVLRVGASGRTEEPARKAAVYRAVDERGVTRGVVAVNADANSGRTDAQSPPAVQTWLAQAFGRGAGDAGALFAWLDREQPSKALAAPEQRSPVSLPLLIAAAALLLLETIMARYFAHAFRDQGAGVAGPLSAQAAALAPAAEAGAAA